MLFRLFFSIAAVTAVTSVVEQLAEG